VINARTHTHTDRVLALSVLQECDKQ